MVSRPINPGDWGEWDHWKDNWSWKGAAVGGVVGGVGGWGYATLGSVGGTLFGCELGPLLAATVRWGAYESVKAYAGGEDDPWMLLAHFAKGAAGRFVSQTGVFGLARYGLAGAEFSHEGASGSIGWFFLAQITDGFVHSALDKALDHDRPLELGMFGANFEIANGGDVQLRFDWVQLVRSGMPIVSGGGHQQIAADFSQHHRHKVFVDLLQYSQAHESESGGTVGAAIAMAMVYGSLEGAWLSTELPGGFGAIAGLAWIGATVGLGSIDAVSNRACHRDRAGMCQY